MARVFDLCLILGAVLTYVHSDKNQDGYEYNEATHSFYKVYDRPVSKEMAQRICEKDDASLLMINSMASMVEVSRIVDSMAISKPVWVSTSGLKTGGRKHVKHQSEAESQMQKGKVCYMLSKEKKIEATICLKNLPFVCQVHAVIVKRNAADHFNCGEGYQRADTVGICYKLSTRRVVWQDAHAECVKDGATLVTLNSVDEHDHVHNLMLTKSSPDFKSFHAGFHVGWWDEQPNGEGLKTLWGDSSVRSGYGHWSPNSGNVKNHEEACGGLDRSDGNPLIHSCILKTGFICEKKIDLYNK